MAIINNDSHPFSDEQFVAAAISTKEYDDSIPLEPDVWTVGGVPRQSFISPWAVHSPRIEDLVAWQGRVTDEFVRDIRYCAGDVSTLSYPPLKRWDSAWTTVLASVEAGES